MECKICGHRARDIASMARHYRDKHPSKMKQKKETPLSRMRRASDKEWLVSTYCPACGHKL